MLFKTKLINFVFGIMSLWLGAGSVLLAADLRSEIESSNEQFVAAMNAGEVDRVVSFFSERGSVLPPNGDMVVGANEVKTFWKTVISGGLKASLETDEVSSFGDYAYELGFYFLKTPEGELKDRGKYIVIWIREQNTWKMYRDIFNSSIALPTQNESTL